MIDVELAAVANQSLTVQVDDLVYSITLREVTGGSMAASVSRNGVKIVSGARVVAGSPLLPSRYQETGNFLITTEGEACPYWDQFGITQFLVYLTDVELEAYRAT